MKLKVKQSLKKVMTVWVMLLSVILISMDRLEASETHIHAAPTVAASNLSFTAVQGDRMTLNWVNGDGASRIVVFRQGSAVTATPTNGKSYSNYTSIASGQRIVYTGTGSSFVFSNTGNGALTAGTTYYFAIYEFNGSGTGTEYLVSPSLSGSQATMSISPKPTVQASAPVLNWRAEETLPDMSTRQKMGISWTPGDGEGTLIIMRAGSPVDNAVFPADGANVRQWAQLGGGNIVCYRGTGSYMEFKSDGIGNLVPGTTYYFAFLQYNGSTITSSYLTTSAPTFNAITLSNKPTVAASSMIFSNVQGTSMDVSWTNGNGSSRIVVANTGTPVSVTPTDGSTYSLYQSLGSGNVVVYSGSSNSFTFSSMGNGTLVPRTTYFLTVFEFSGSGTTTSYLISPSLSGSHLSGDYYDEPTVASSSMLFSNVTTTSMTVNWTSGNGANRIVVARAGSAVTAVPTDGNVYSLYQTLSSGQVVVYNGSANTFDFTSMGSGGLTAGTTYFLTVFEYNGATNTINYLTSSVLSGSQATSSLATEPGVSSNSMVFSNVQTSSMTVTWNSGNGSNRIVIARAGSAVTASPADGSAYSLYQSVAAGQIVVYNGSANTFSFNSMGSGGLTPGTTYFLTVYEYNGTSTTINYLTSSSLSGNQATSSLATEPTTASTGLIFSGVLANSMTVSWTAGNGANRIVVARAGSAVTAVPADGSAYTLYQALSSGQVVVYNGSANTFNFNSMGSGGLTSGITYFLTVYEYNGTSTTINYLTSSSLSGSQATVAASGKPTVAASGLIFSSVTTKSMTVSWTNGNGANRLVVARAGSPVATAPVDGSSYSLYQTVGSSGNIVVYKGSSNTFNFSSMGNGSLTPGVTYHLAIFEFNGSGGATSYLTASFLSGNQVTVSLAAEPTVSSTGLVFSSVASTSMSVNWTNGDGTSRIVIARAGSPVTSVPVDGTSYSLYQTVGSAGQVTVYQGSGSGFTFNSVGSGGLTPGTTYYLAIYEYNGSGALVNYLTSSLLSGNQTTLSSGRLSSDDASVVSNTDYSAATELNIYPIPATSFINIEVNGSAQNVELLFYSYSGDLINRMFVNAGTESNVDLSSWKKGVYFVKINHDKGNSVKKIILQ